MMFSCRMSMNNISILSEFLSEVSEAERDVSDHARFTSRSS